MKDIFEDLAMLSGYLDGVASMNGLIRECTASAFLLDVGPKDAPIENLIVDYFSPARWKEEFRDSFDEESEMDRWAELGPDARAVALANMGHRIDEDCQAAGPLIFESVECIQDGLGGLERDIRTFLVNVPLGIPCGVIDSHAIDERRRYVSFRVMDLVGRVIGLRPQSVCVTKLITDRKRESRVDIVYYSLRFGSRYLVLQFDKFRGMLGRD